MFKWLWTKYATPKEYFERTQDQTWQTYNRWKVDKNVDMFEVSVMESAKWHN